MNRVYNTMTRSRTDDMKNFIRQQVEQECEAIHSHAEISARAFYKELASKLPGWVDNYRSLHHVDDIFKVKSQSKAFTEELVNSLQCFIKEETNVWARTHFIPMVGREIYNLRCSINHHARMLHEPLGQVNVSIDIDKSAIVKGTIPSAKNRVLSSGASLLIGDLGGAIMGGVGGSDAMLKTMSCEFLAGITLGILSLFTPVGLATLIGGVITSAFVGGTWALGSIENKIRKAVVKSSIEHLNSPREVDKFMKVIHIKIDSLLNPLRQDFIE